MKEEIEQRFAELLESGKQLIKNIPWGSDGSLNYWVRDDNIPSYQEWLSSCANLLRMVAPHDSHFSEECQRLLTHQDMRSGIPATVAQKMFGLVSSAREEWKHGLLRKIEYVVAAETFDEFLDHASLYHKGGKKIEASVLASAVFEDTVKKIAAKNKVASAGQSLEPLIEELVKANILTPVKAKRLKGHAGVRNYALHAEWDKFDIRDVGELINGVREIIENYL
jgi:uncharacterized protein YutE (UPF0331/DUF86 family)